MSYYLPALKISIGFLSRSFDYGALIICNVSLEKFQLRCCLVHSVPQRWHRVPQEWQRCVPT